MTRTGWISEGEGEAPEPGPPMPLTELALARNRQQEAGSTLAVALARSAGADARQARAEAADAPDPDERAAGLINAGYSPGLMFELSQRHGDAQRQLEEEQEKIENGARRAEYVRRMLEGGQIGALDAARRLDDGDAGDQSRVELLQRRCERLASQIREMAELTRTPEARAQDAVEQAAQRAQRAAAQVREWARAEDEAEDAARKQMAADRRAFRASWRERLSKGLRP